MAEKQEQKRTKSFGDLPIELFTDIILPRLPPQTILRCKAVCKDWYNAITSLKFVEARLKCKSTLPQRVLLLRHEVNHNFRIFSLSYDENEKSNSLVNLTELTCNGISKYRCSIVDSSNGLLCLDLIDVNQFAIWNPITRQYKEIAYCQEMLTSLMMGLEASAFGYNYLTDDYNIFALFSQLSPSSMGYKSNIFYLFSFRSGIWKELTVLRGTHFRSEYGVWIKGQLYWPRNDFASGLALGLFVFDLATEEMKHISISTSFSEYGYKYVKHIFEINDCLAFSCFKEEEPYHVWKNSRVEGVDNWSKLFAFDSSNFSVFGFTGKGNCFVHVPDRLKLLNVQKEDESGGDESDDSSEGIECCESIPSLRSSYYVETFGAFKIQD